MSRRRAAGRFAVQVGAFGDARRADELVAQLRVAGLPAYVKRRCGGARGDALARARRTRRDRGGAEALAAKLTKGEKLPTWILDESER